MGAVPRLNHVVAALSMLAAATLVQPSEAQSIPSGLRELASKVASHDDGALETYETQLLSRLADLAVDFPTPRKEWWLKVAPLATKQAMDEVKATRRVKLEAVLADKFSEDELTKVLKFQDFLVQKNLQEVILKSLNAPSLQERQKILRAAMSARDYRQYNDFYQSAEGQKFVRVTLPVYSGVAAELEQHFADAMKQHCSSAPAGMPECVAGSIP